MVQQAQLDLLTRLDAELAGITDLDTVLERVLAGARDYYHADAGSIYVREGEQLRFACAQCQTLEQQLPPGERLVYHSFRIPINDESLAGHAAQSGESLAIADAYAMPDDLPCQHSKAFDEKTGYVTRSILTVPLKTNAGEVIGVLQLINRLSEAGVPIPFSQDDVLTIGHFAMRAALALYQARLTRSLALRMIEMAELRDPAETGPHANRVAAYAVELYQRWSQRLGLPPEKRERERDLLRTAAMLHDVGKVGIPDAILKKPGKLTDEEFDIMREHTVIGAKLFSSHESQLDMMAATIALNHHENWDGTGYPGHRDPASGAFTGRGKAGEEIPMVAHLVSIADVYDALCSPRSYKEAWTPEEALKELGQLAGTKFCPALVEIFLDLAPVVRAIQARYPDE